MFKFSLLWGDIKLVFAVKMLKLKYGKQIIRDYLAYTQQCITYCTKRKIPNTPMAQKLMKEKYHNLSDKDFNNIFFYCITRRLTVAEMISKE